LLSEIFFWLLQKGAKDGNANSYSFSIPKVFAVIDSKMFVTAEKKSNSNCSAFQFPAFYFQTIFVSVSDYLDDVLFLICYSISVSEEKKEEEKILFTCSTQK
jgi:hypothetical protein